MRQVNSPNLTALSLRSAALLTSFALLFLPACSKTGSEAATNTAPTAPPLAVKVVHPHRGTISRTVILPADVLPYQQALLCAKVAGYLKKINVDKGDAVHEGDLLAEIEVPELIAEQARSKAEVQVANIEYKRVSDAQAKAPDLVVPQAVDNAKARLEVAQANLERDNTLLAYSRISAPFSGIITRRYVDPGAFIPAATSANTQSSALLNVMDFGRVRVQAAVPENEVPLVKVGLSVRVQIEELKDHSFDGQVTRFAHALDDATKTMLTEIELPNPDALLRPGMYATIHLAVETRTNSLLVPTEALLVEKTKTSVFTVAGKQARKIPVRLGFNDGSSAEIVEGLKDDEPVILIGKQVLNDGQEIQVTEAK